MDFFSQILTLHFRFCFLAQLCYPTEVGALFTTLPSIIVLAELVGLGLSLLLRLGLVGLALWLVSGIALNKYRCE